MNEKKFIFTVLNSLFKKKSRN